MTTALVRRMMGAQSLLLGGTGPTTPPQTLLTRHAVDVSNYTAFLGLTSTLTWKNDYDIGLVIVQSLDAERFPQSRTIQQLIVCHAAGIPTDLYVYPFFANGAQDCATRLREALSAGVAIRRVWLDVEDVDPSQRAWTPQQRVDMVSQWLATCDSFNARIRPAGIYTGRWYWDDPNYMAGSTAFSDRPLWAAQYDGIDDTNVFTPFGGWSTCAIKQYRGTTTLAGIGGVDLDVLSDAERVLT